MNNMMRLNSFLFSSLLFVLSSISHSTSADLDADESLTFLTPEDSLRHFQEWLDARNITLQHAKVSGLLSHRGIYAAQDLAADTIVVSVPLTAVLHIEHAAADADFAADFAALSDTEAMAAFIAIQRVRAKKTRHNEEPYPEPAKSYAGYIDSFPSFHYTPLYWSEQQREAAQNCDILQTSNRRWNATQRSYNEKFSQHIRDEITLEHYKWGLSCLLSRMHSLAVKDRQGKWIKTSALIPVADLLNAASKDQVNVACETNRESTHFVCKTTVEVKKNHALLTQYGSDLSNTRLMLDYGFTLPDNEHDYKSFEMPGIFRSDNDTDESIQVKLQLLHLFNRSDDRVFRINRISDERKLEGIDVFEAIGSPLWIYSRILALQPIEAKHEKVSDLLKTLKANKQISAENEITAIQLILDALQREMKQYATSIEEDEVLFMKEAEETLRHIINLRLTEKYTMQDIIDLLTEFKRSIEAGEKTEIQLTEEQSQGTMFIERDRMPKGVIGGEFVIGDSQTQHKDNGLVVVVDDDDDDDDEDDDEEFELKVDDPQHSGEL